MLKKRLFVFIFFLFSAISYADITNFNNDLNNTIKDENASVIKVNNNEIEVNKGYSSGFFINRKVQIIKKGEPIYHPITKELLGTRDVKVAEGIVVESNTDSAKVKIMFKSSDITPLEYYAAPAKPVEICFDTQTDNEENKKYEALLKESLNSNKNYIISDNCQVDVKIKSDDAGIFLSLSQKDGRVLKTLYYPKGDVVTIKKEVKVEDLVKSDTIDGGYHSLAILNVGNKKIIALAGKTKVDFFEVNKITKIEQYSMTYRGEVLNVESYDVDKDGSDDLIISKLDRNLMPNSEIYRFDEKGFRNLAKNLNYLFRTVYYDNKKELLYQSVESEKFDKNIFVFTSLDNLGKDAPKLTSQNYNIYNIGFGDFDGDKKTDIIYYDKDKKIEIISDNKVIYKSARKFGTGAKYFILNRKIKDKENHGYSDKDDVLDLLKYRQYIFPRVYVKDGELFTYANELKFPAFPLREIFSSAKIEKISFNNVGLQKVWDSDLIEPRVIDIYLSPETGETYLAVLNLKQAFLEKNEKTNLMIIKFN